MSGDFSPAFSAWVDALEYVNDLTTKELLCMNEAWDAALEWDRCRRIDEYLGGMEGESHRIEGDKATLAKNPEIVQDEKRGQCTNASSARCNSTSENEANRVRETGAGDDGERPISDPLVTRIERMRGAIADARVRIVQQMPDGPARGSIIAFLDQAAYGREHPAQCFNSFPGATMCEVCGGDLECPPWCDCPGPWCEGRDRNNRSRRCLGYQIDPDGGAK